MKRKLLKLEQLNRRKRLLIKHLFPLAHRKPITYAELPNIINEAIIPMPDNFLPGEFRSSLLGCIKCNSFTGAKITLPYGFKL